jgi:O-antigen ligase
MSTSPASNFVKKNYFLPISAALTVFAFLPNNADPLNPIKFWILGFTATYCVFKLAYETGKGHFLSALRPTSKYFSVIFFGVALITAFIFTDVKTTGLIGFTGRNNGLLFYLFLIVIYIYTVKKITSQGVRPFFAIVPVSCFALDIYGTLQHFNLDFEKWKNPYSPVILFIGNPDFAASLLGIFTVILCTLLFVKLSKIHKILIALIIAFTLEVIYWTHAKQGLLGTALGVGVLFLGLLWRRNFKAGLFLLSIEVILGLLAVFGTLQIGPLSRYLYKGSINDRGYDWRAAWHMFTEHPWVGVGLDRYGSYFFQYRDAKYPLIYGYQQSVNNSHNIFLEFFATGGVFLGVAYVVLISFIGLRSFRLWQKKHGDDKIYVLGLISAWVVYVAQSTISVDNICVSIWGWLFAAVIVGLSFEHDSQIKENYKRQISKVLKSRTRVTIFLIPGAILVITIFVFMYLGESRMYILQRFPAPSNSSEQIIYNKVATKAFQTPLLSSDYKILIAFNVTNAGDIDRGVELFKQVLSEDPRSYDAHTFLAVIYEHKKDYTSAITHRQINKSLNPFGADNLLQLERDYIQIGKIAEAQALESEILQIAPGSQISLDAKKALINIK